MKHLKLYQIVKGKLVVSDKLSMCGAFLEVPIAIGEFETTPLEEQCQECIVLAKKVQEEMRAIEKKPLLSCMSCNTPTPDEELLRNDCICDDCAKSIFGGGSVGK